jgi:hypothetical protein
MFNLFFSLDFCVIKCYTQGMENAETSKRNPPQHRGVFLGAWVTPQMKRDVRRVADVEFYGNLSMAMMKLLDEALTARESDSTREEEEAE